jgi:hypothetical protein
VTEATANNGADTVNGVEQFTYTAHDAGGNTTTGTITINVIDDVPQLGTIQPLTADDNPADPTATGTLHLTPGADGIASVTISPDLTGLMSGGHSLVGSQTGNVYTAYADVNGNGVIDGGETAVFTITVDPSAGTSGQYTFDLLQALDPTVTPFTIGSGSSFGSGPSNSVVVTDTATSTNLVFVTGWSPNAGFNDTSWLNGGNPDLTQTSNVNGSTQGWGLANNNLDSGEFMRFDFGALNDYDGSGPYTAPGSPTIANVSYATFTFFNFGSGDEIQFLAHYENGTTQSFDLKNGSASSLTITAPSGTNIAWVDVYESSGSIKMNLSQVGVITSSFDKTIPVSMTFTDGDGDQVTGSTTIHVADGLTASTPVAPIALDLNGDGHVTFLSANAGVTFDYNGDGVRESTAWVGPQDGILVHDANHNGTVDSATEFVFGANGQTDLQSLAVFDTNHDGKLTAADTAFSSFGVWQDANSNGVVDPGEYHTLTQLGITSISLTSNGISYEAAGGDVTVAGTGTYTKADGTTGVLADASFWTGSRTSTTDTRSSNPLLSNPALLGAVAAAGLAAAEPLAANGHDSNPTAVVAQTLGTEHTQSLAPVALTVASNHAPSESPLAGTQNNSGVTQPQHDSHGSDTVVSNQHSSDHGQQQAAPSELPQGTDAPAHGPATANAAIIANAIHMPAAAQLQALVSQQHAAPTGAQTDAGHQVGQVLADALAGGAGHGSVIDTVLHNVASHGGPVGGLNPLASHFEAGVSNGDNGHLAAFTAIQTANMEHLIAHAHAAHPHG